MVFKKDSKLDAFQRQIGALRQQLGPNPDESPSQAGDQDQYAGEPIDVPEGEQSASQYGYAASTGNAYQAPDVNARYGTYPAPESAEEQFDDMSTPAMPAPRRSR